MINQKTDFLGNAYDKNGFLLKNCVVEHCFFCYVFAYLGLKRILSYKGGGRKVEGKVQCFSNFFDYTQELYFVCKNRDPVLASEHIILPFL